MKKIIALLMTLTMLIPIASATLIDTTFTGSGSFHFNFVADDDAELEFTVEGNDIDGELHAEDQNDNPYNYEVDTVDVKTRVSIGNGGWLEYNFKRLTSWERMYGPAGQISYTYLATNESGSFAWHSNSNYARLRNCNYGWQSDNQIQASGNYTIIHGLYRENYGAEIYLILYIFYLLFLGICL